MGDLAKQNKHATVRYSSSSKADAAENGKEARMQSVEQHHGTNGGATAKRPSYKVTSEGRVVVDVQELMKSKAVQRIAKMAEEIAALSAKADRR